MKWSLDLAIVLVLGFGFVHSVHIVQIVGIFDPVDALTKSTFFLATGTNHTTNPQTVLSTVISVPRSDSNVVRKICSAIKNGVAGVIGPPSSDQSAQVHGVCSATKLPHLEIHPAALCGSDNMTLNLHPHPSTVGLAVRELLRTWKWNVFTVINDQEYGSLYLSEILKVSSGDRSFQVTVRDLPPNTNNYRDFLFNISSSGNTRIVLNCSPDKIASLLKQGLTQGVTAAWYTYIATTLDLHTLDVSELKLLGTSVFGFTIVDLELKSREMFSLVALTTDKSYRSVRTQDVLTYDAVKVLIKTIDEVPNLTTEPLSCETTPTWTLGTAIINIIKKKTYSDTLSGPLMFDENGFRSAVNLSMVQLRSEGSRKVGDWKMTKQKLYRLNIDLKTPSVSSVSLDKPLVVSSILTTPYVMLKQSSSILYGNDRYEGFTVDLLKLIANHVGFNYTIRIVADGKYGTRNPTTGKWNGMIGEVIDEKADMAMGDVTISAGRERDIDFTFPFVHFGFGVMMKTPLAQTRDVDLLAFLIPFTVGTWLYIVAAYVIVSLSFYVIARLSKGDDASCEVEDDGLTITNSWWFALGSLMWQGSQVKPRGFSSCLLAGVWWFFTVILICSYIANMTSWLQAHPHLSQKILRINEIEDLLKYPNMRFGCVNSGTTCSYFRDSDHGEFQQMWKRMSSQVHPPSLVATSAEGITRVREGDGNYGFLMESLSAEYVTREDCDIHVAGVHASNKGHAIAIRKDSPYRESLNYAILKLQENSTIYKLKNKWWKTDEPNKCDPLTQTLTETEPMRVEVYGLFIVLIVGIVLAFITGVAEFVVRVHRTAVVEREGFSTVAVRELKAVAYCGNTARSSNSHLILRPDVELRDSSENLRA